MAAPKQEPPASGMVVLSTDQLRTLIDETARVAVRDEIGQLMEPRFLTTADVAAMLQVCTRQVTNLVKTEGLPVARQLGRELRFERDQIVEWMRLRGDDSGRPAERSRLRRGHLEKRT
jgi:excisionase family DNA binding protein